MNNVKYWLQYIDENDLATTDYDSVLNQNIHRKKYNFDENISKHLKIILRYILRSTHQRLVFTMNYCFYILKKDSSPIILNDSLYHLMTYNYTCRPNFNSYI